MTIEEAITILKQEQWYMGRYSEEYAKAYDMAIEALEKIEYLNRQLGGDDHD